MRFCRQLLDQIGQRKRLLGDRAGEATMANPSGNPAQNLTIAVTASAWLAT